MTYVKEYIKDYRVCAKSSSINKAIYRHLAIIQGEILFESVDELKSFLNLYMISKYHMYPNTEKVLVDLFNDGNHYLSFGSCGDMLINLKEHSLYRPSYTYKEFLKIYDV